MTASSRTFSLVDRIFSVEPGARVRGHFAVPSSISDFPPSLVVEAVGQLAAWSAMATLEFRKRPVAGIAGSVEMLGEVGPGEHLDLAVDIDSVDAEAVSYSGQATCNGKTLVRLQNCVGPMMSVEEFDDPQSLRERFAQLCSDEGAGTAFQGIPSVGPQDVEKQSEQSITAQIQVPAAAAFFADHFPRRPVFPGTLLMHANLQLALQFLEHLPGPGQAMRWQPRTVRDVKLRTFIPPGELLQSQAKLLDGSSGKPVISLETRNGKRTIGVARVVLSAAPV
jgi:3-hydroxymyristoyl/3-hydroxydecanoyl-(acyl carrier protein) dehydratase